MTSSMNRFEKLLGLKGEARLRFLDGEFQVLSPGDFVRCAVTGEPIMLPDLRYWSVELQEAYASAEISFERHRTVKARGAEVARRCDLRAAPSSAVSTSDISRSASGSAKDGFTGSTREAAAELGARRRRRR